MATSTLSQFTTNSIIPVPTELVEEFNRNKKTLDIFKELKEGEKLGKQKNSENELEYYKVTDGRFLFISRWYYGEGREKTITYLDEDFSSFMKFLDSLVTKFAVDPFCVYIKLTKEAKEFVDVILPGLYSLKKTYPETKEMVAKVDSIILTLIDFKDKADDLIRQKENSKIRHLFQKPKIGTSFEI